ncbi:MAG: DegT/DnrJ/EryC1/StrS family aminotransferase [Polyangiales bacterium]|nr:DegT/DnrJ/EryC1/StrS family aminotransferase [Myxococcales bacterium]
MRVPLLRLDFGDRETRALGEVLASGMLVQGARVEAFEAAVKARTGRHHAVAVANGTAALELALEALGIGPGDDVLCPDLTWPSPGHAILRRGARPVLVDVHADEWNAAPEALAAARTAQTKAAIVVDQFGVPARWDALPGALPGLALIEDAACAIGSKLGNASAGAFGQVACLSFHPRKVLTTGEGGMCLTDDDALDGKLRMLRNHGQQTPGEFVDAGGNERLGELAAALGLSQLGRLDAMIGDRLAQATRYRAELPELAFQALPGGATWNAQTLGAVLPEPFDAARRDALVRRLGELGVGAGRLSYALHELPQFARAANEARALGRSFPNAERLASRGVALPCFPGMTNVEQAHVIEAVKRALLELR